MCTGAGLGGSSFAPSASGDRKESVSRGARHPQVVLCAAVLQRSCWGDTPVLREITAEGSEVQSKSATHLCLGHAAACPSPPTDPSRRSGFALRSCSSGVSSKTGCSLHRSSNYRPWSGQGSRRGVASTRSDSWCRRGEGSPAPAPPALGIAALCPHRGAGGRRRRPRTGRQTPYEPLARISRQQHLLTTSCMCPERGPVSS